MNTVAKWIIAAVAVFAITGAQAQDSSRKEIKRTDLTGKNMEVILSVSEYKPGDLIPRHIHHGVEAFYVIQGATLETPTGKHIKLGTGAGAMNLRDVPHGGVKVVGDSSLKLATVHIVDKGKPLYDAPPKVAAQH